MLKKRKRRIISTGIPALTIKVKRTILEHLDTQFTVTPSGLIEGNAPVFEWLCMCDVKIKTRITWNRPHQGASFLIATSPDPAQLHPLQEGQGPAGNSDSASMTAHSGRTTTDCQGNSTQLGNRPRQKSNQKIEQLLKSENKINTHYIGLASNELGF